MPSWAYMLLCADGSFYTGCTTELETRFGQPQRRETRSDSEECGVLVGVQIPISCSDESRTKSCSCLSLTNKCGYAVTASYRVAGVSRAWSVPIGSGKRNTEACSSQRGQTVEYLGFTRRP